MLLAAFAVSGKCREYCFKLTHRCRCLAVARGGQSLNACSLQRCASQEHSLTCYCPVYIHSAERCATAYSAANPVDAPTMVGGQPLAQIFLFCGLLETIFHKGKLTVEDMHNNNEEPGSFGFGKHYCCYCCCCCKSVILYVVAKYV
jgi:hypothetical protein